MKFFIVFAAFVAAASASVGIIGSGIGTAQVLSSVRTIHPIATNVITPVVTPVVRHVVTPVLSKVITPAVVSTPILRTIPVRTHFITPINPIIGLGGHGGYAGYHAYGKK